MHHSGVVTRRARSLELFRTAKTGPAATQSRPVSPTKTALAMAAMMPAMSLAAARLARRAFLAATDHGAAGRRELALVLEQAGSDLAAVGNELVAKPLSIALAGVLGLHANVIPTLCGGGRSPHKAPCHQQPGSHQPLAQDCYR